MNTVGVGGLMWVKVGINVWKMGICILLEVVGKVIQGLQYTLDTEGIFVL